MSESDVCGALEALRIAAVAAGWIQGNQKVHDQQWEEDWQRLHGHDELFEGWRATEYMRSQVARLNAEDEPRNEHVYKLVAVADERLQELAAEYDAAQCKSFQKQRMRSMMVDLCSAVALCMSCEFSGRGIGERPTAKTNLGDAPARMHQLAGCGR
eukprot:gnl/TRDRNA2_/TRDRNA2_170399_c1_seq1.p1 gnl/TRDRNA2_/TRDRNA2_170399_c1~~gnl/TRDRNA2_/TRDRNA2_170399_c1_seq1.p1  ORF type:complete len:156 (+),score=28.38 gnl/TRDRNA2_/TRDRNA2_170399_c1_seq1:149-616(+)